MQLCAQWVLISFHYFIIIIIYLFKFDSKKENLQFVYL